MAEHGVAEYGTATGNDYAEHRRSYAYFVAFAKWGAIGSAVVLILMAIFLL